MKSNTQLKAGSIGASDSNDLKITIQKIPCNEGRVHPYQLDGYTLVLPNNSIGADGNVFYDAKASGCWIKVAGVWKSSNVATLTTDQRAAVYTVTPSATAATAKPPLTNVNQTRANDICVAAADPDYGAKRLLRHREYIAAAAWPTDWSTAAIDTMEYTTDLDHLTNAAKARCNTKSATGLTCDFPTGDCAGANVGTVKQVIIGANSTKNCSSRFGAQDMVGNVDQYMSDQLDQCNAGSSHSCTGITSNIDSGNRDLNGFYFDGTAGHSQGPGGSANGQLFPGGDPDGFSSGTLSWLFSVGVAGGTAVAQGFGAGYFSAPMGLPMVGSDGGNALAIGAGISTAKLQGDSFTLFSDGTYTLPDADGTSHDDTGVLRSAVVGGATFTGAPAGRWNLSLAFSRLSTWPYLGFRCSVAPSEQ
ncbi:hypothetical protein WDW37_11600 [Bdellovibrionota bacterium FG-1]